MTKIKDKYRGCLIGGAVGDALGYAVEFPRKTAYFQYTAKAGSPNMIMIYAAVKR